MTNDRLNQLHLIASRARRWAMRNRQRAEMPYDLTGMCGIASGKLWSMLTESGFNARIAIRNKVGDGHCFVIVDNYIVDVTATQFGLRAVEVRPAKDARQQHRFWRATKIHNDLHSLRQHQINTGWPSDQVAWEV